MIRVIYDLALNPISVLDLPSIYDDLSNHVEDGITYVGAFPLFKLTDSLESVLGREITYVYIRVVPIKYSIFKGYLLMVDPHSEKKLKNVPSVLLETQKLFYEEKNNA